MDREQKTLELTKKLLDLGLVLLTTEEHKEIIRLLDVVQKEAEGLEVEHKKLKGFNTQLLTACKVALKEGPYAENILKVAIEAAEGAE